MAVDILNPFAMFRCRPLGHFEMPNTISTEFRLRESKDYQCQQELRETCFSKKSLIKDRYDDFDGTRYLGLTIGDNWVASLRLTNPDSVIDFDTAKQAATQVNTEFSRGCVMPNWRRKGLMNFLVVKAIEFEFKEGTSLVSCLHVANAPHAKILNAMGFDVVGQPVRGHENDVVLLRQLSLIGILNLVLGQLCNATARMANESIKIVTN